MLGQIEQRMLNLAFSGLQIGIGIYDKDGHMMTSNEEFNRLQNDYPQDCELLRRSIREGKSGKEQWIREDGTVLESFVVPFTNDQGETDGYIFRLSNITERRPRYGSEDQSRLEEIFLNNVNHEIRTPLNAIIGFNDLLNGVAGEHMEEEEKRIMKDHIHRNAERLINVVNDLVDLSKMEKGSLIIHKTVVSLMEICYKARESVKNEVQPGVKLLHQYPVVLKDTRIYTDGRRMVQLLRNILSNACKHTSMGAITLRVRTVESDDSQGQPRLQIRVSDTGEGIPVENRSQLFMPFRKFDGVTDGLGMGLAISRQIAKMLGGRLYLDEDYEGGSSFVYEMPFEEA